MRPAIAPALTGVSAAGTAFAEKYDVGHPESRRAPKSS